MFGFDLRCLAGFALRVNNNHFAWGPCNKSQRNRFFGCGQYTIIADF